MGHCSSDGSRSAVSWTIDKARELYSTANWGGGYFDVNGDGHLVCRPDRDPAHPGVDLVALVREVREAGLILPVLVRFTGILHDRVDTLCGAFAAATAAESYRGRYTAVYPIKVNQQRRVVEEILRHGGGRVGLEAGSKPELMAVLALSRPGRGVIICNGYKDREYIRLGHIARAMGHRIHLVIEKLSELETVIATARELGVKPLLGIRVRLASIGAGKWQNTGGEKAKFGLSAAQVLEVVRRLKAADMLECLQLLHFHMGSQIANIRDIQAGLREGARYYAELHRLGVPIGTVDIGGGLGVDYEGTRSRAYCSMNYSVQEYANNVVHLLAEVCAEENLPHPDIITESGRAMTAHHAVLLTNVIDIERGPDQDVPPPPVEAEPLILRDLRYGLEHLDRHSAVEAYHDALYWLAQSQEQFVHGLLSLDQRALAERLYAATCRRVRELLAPGKRSHREVLDELDEKLADKYFCNFSLFQSLPDAWAIDQSFPIVPLQRLDERPGRRAVIEDLTCDSDGRIDTFVEEGGTEHTLPLHAVAAEEDYLLGIFLVGAYQEILGDMHNLFGDTDSVHVEALSGGGHRLVEPVRGDTVDNVLRYVHFEAEALLAAYRDQLESAALPAATRAGYLEELEAGLRGYTYLED